ncbi:hypothetical protein RHSIM_Rhsim11G0125000 [Rhododendron simsii]|uniref:Uncharacterized protein n=1 Tax=Rhododendron simsii TaxID=118357 RepID=A0A834LBN3_RHOSS|nr:hypothetical protein RHSIM_Rhsim11G0125000 [Rhododendron simsii]
MEGSSMFVRQSWNVSHRDSLWCQPKDTSTSVAFHRSYPLFASCSDGMVYPYLNKNPLLFHWKFSEEITSSSGKDFAGSVIRLQCCQVSGSDLFKIKWGRKAFQNGDRTISLGMEGS